MSARLYIPVPCLNRRLVVEQCLPTISETKLSCDYLHLWNDGSSEYDSAFLKQWADRVDNCRETKGIEAQRRAHLLAYWEMRHAYTGCYFSDSDALMDPSWRSQALGLQEENEGKLVCLYNTKAHSEMKGNTLEDDPAKNYIVRYYAPGISYLLTLAHVEKIMPWLSQMRSFDWDIPRILGHRCIISRVSYVEHIGHGGLHHKDEYGIEGGDRALSPTPYLAAKRADVIESLRKRT